MEKEGDQILILGDLNEYINSRRIRSFFSNLGLRELILERHGTNGPATTRSNTSQQAIDGIWATHGINISTGGYLPFHNGPKSDHRILWIKVPMITAFGGYSPPTRVPAERRLRLHHPRIQNKYTKSLKQHLRHHNILERLQHLNSNHSVPLTHEQTTEYEDIDNTIMKGRRMANEKCRRIYLSAVHTSKKIKNAQLRLRFVSLLLESRKPGSKIKQKTTDKLAQITGRRWWITLEKNALIVQRRKARREYLQLKKNSAYLRVTYIEERARQMAEQGNTTEEQRLHSLLNTEKERERSLRLKRLNPQRKGQGVTRLVIEKKQPSMTQEAKPCKQ